VPIETTNSSLKGKLMPPGGSCDDISDRQRYGFHGNMSIGTNCSLELE